MNGNQNGYFINDATGDSVRMAGPDADSERGRKLLARGYRRVSYNELVALRRQQRAAREAAELEAWYAAHPDAPRI